MDFWKAGGLLFVARPGPKLLKEESGVIGTWKVLEFFLMKRFLTTTSLPCGMAVMPAFAEDRPSPK
jgi:hypothetical protein